MTGHALAAAARTLVGVPFRLHGRDPATGLDCIGVLAASLARCGRPAPLPTGYALRHRILPDAQAIASACGLAPSEAPEGPGDVVLVHIAPVQHHLLIAMDGGHYVHAHAGLRRVVCGPFAEGWRIAGTWRLANED
jgi:cell wall-associated NlpC family hydrolase